MTWQGKWYPDWRPLALPNRSLKGARRVANQYSSRLDSACILAACALVAFLSLSIMIIVLGLGVGAPLSASEQVGELADIVVVTEDTAPESVNSGCDAISIHNIRSGKALDKGIKHISPGRLAATSDLSMIVANMSNSCGAKDLIGQFPPENSNCDPWLNFRIPTDNTFLNVTDAIRVGGSVATQAGIAFNLQGGLLVATGAGAHEQYLRIPARAPYGVSRYQFDSSTLRSGPLARPIRSRRTDSLVGEILTTDVEGEILLATLGGRLYQVDPLDLQDLRSPITFPTPISPANSRLNTKPPIGGFHATYSYEQRLVAIGGLQGGDVILVSTENGRVVRQSVAPGVTYVGGVAFNNGWNNRGLLAIHAVDRIIVLAVDSTMNVDALGEFMIDPPYVDDRQIAHAITGPSLSVEWSADGAFIIAAADDGTAEFVILEFDSEALEIVQSGSIVACQNTINLPNDIWTANGLITATPRATASSTPPPVRTPTPSPTASPLPSSTSTLTPVPTSTSVSSPSPTPTRPPSPAYLPISITESCEPVHLRIDVALAIDASSSMGEPATRGSATSKLEAAKDAVGTFLDVLDFDEGDQAAIISFHSDAWLHAPLTSSRETLDDALAAVELGEQTRIDRGIEVSAAALLDTASRDPSNVPVLVLLTDGRANPVPVDVAVELSADAKSDGITIFTIGLGGEVESEALRQMASEPAYYLQAPTAGDLTEIYREVARSIPCPARAFWGHR